MVIRGSLPIRVGRNKNEYGLKQSMKLLRQS